MKKDELIEHLEYALKQVLCKDLVGIDRVAMESSIDCFMSEEVAACTSEELLEKFYTPEMSIKLFMDFLAQKGALEETDGGTIH